jgi:hypothetical protein
MATMT